MDALSFLQHAARPGVVLHVLLVIDTRAPRETGFPRVRTDGPLRSLNPNCKRDNAVVIVAVTATARSIDHRLRVRCCSGIIVVVGVVAVGLVFHSGRP